MEGIKISRCGKHTTLMQNECGVCKAYLETDKTIATQAAAIEALEEHNQNAQSLNSLLELRVEELEGARDLMTQEYNKVIKRNTALVEAARAVAGSALWIPESDRRVVGHDEFYALAALIGGEDE